MVSIDGGGFDLDYVMTNIKSKILNWKAAHNFLRYGFKRFLCVI